ncbi:hypothetical protein DM02DRAFT_541949, partial [Periconia macrospinosa]
GKDWLKIKTLINSVVPDPSDKRVQKIHRSLHHMAVKDNLQKTEIEGLRKAQQVQKAQDKAAKAQQKLLKLQEQEERKRLRVKKKEERERIKAAKQGARERKKQEKQNTQRSIQTSQKGKRKASKPITNPVQKKQKRGADAEVGGDAQARDPQPIRTTRGGRNISLPSKFK